MMIVSRNNISLAWAEALVTLVDGTKSEAIPLVVSVSISPNSPLEIASIRNAIDDSLATANLQSVQTVASTIFPECLWRISGGDRHKLFRQYKDNYPRYIRIEPVRNRRGLYFQRLIDYEGFDDFDGNQLEYIISSYCERDGVRRSKFQASVFDPSKDHVPDARLIFPCLQQISLVPVGDNLSLNAFYATQLLYQKAYGNFLGLVRLGQFMANEMGLTLTNFTCFVGVEKIGVTKSTVRDLADVLRPLIV